MSKHHPCRLWMNVGEATLLKIFHVLMFTTNLDTGASFFHNAQL